MKFQPNHAVIVVSLIAAFGILQFLLGVASAIQIYADHPYQWHSNFLSDLGMLESFCGRDNSRSAAIFNSAVIRLGFCFIPFYVVAPQVLTRFQRLAIVSGVVSSFGMVTIGLTPYDKYFWLHHVALAFWIVPMLITMSLFLLRSYEQRYAHKSLMFVTGLVLVASIAYVAAGSHAGHVIVQKVLAVCAILWFCFVVCLISVSVYCTIAPGRKLAEEQAEAYLAILRTEHRKF